MEKPDDKGFVNITWPSKNIPHGGIFHAKTISQLSTDQQQFLKVLLEESKFNLSLRQKNYLGLRQENKQKPRETRAEIPLVRPRTSRRRSLSAIRESENLNVEVFYPPKRGVDREKLKEKLANTMTYGDVEQKPPSPPRLVKQKLKLLSNEEQWNDLVTQIRERAEWLADMEDLGHAGPHRDLIKDQIAERMRALDALGIDSRCSSARSKGSGFSVVPSERSFGSGKSSSSTGSKKQIRQKSKRNLPKSSHNREENVSAYEKLSPLQYSPRRRV